MTGFCEETPWFWEEQESTWVLEGVRGAGREHRPGASLRSFSPLRTLSPRSIPWNTSRNSRPEAKQPAGLGAGSWPPQASWVSWARLTRHFSGAGGFPDEEQGDLIAAGPGKQPKW